MASLALAASLGVLVSACASPQTTGVGVDAYATAEERDNQLAFQMRDYIRDFARVQDAAANIAFANADQCGDRVAPRFGFYAIDERVYEDPDQRRVAREEGIVGEHPRVISVGSRGPLGGLVEKGDEIVAVDGRSARAFIESGEEAPMRTHRFSLLRDGAPVEIDATPQIMCDVPVEVVDGQAANAYTDGERIVVERGLLRAADTDDEIALVIGHELGHVASGHIEARQQNAVVGVGLGVLADVGMALLGVNTGGAFTRGGGQAGASAFTQDFEREADYVGGYFAARAGYDVENGKAIWRRIGSMAPDSISYAGTHPTTPERYVALDQAADEIRESAEMGMPLAPRGWTSRM